ncbi:hypothetical protein JH26_10355 [Microvirga sp. BSC39]|nr:hypothetical protein JH26_10355 [Microvirga sp. BSC39]
MLPSVLACRLGTNYIVQCSTAIDVAVLQPFLGVSSLNFGPLSSGLFSLGVKLQASHTHAIAKKS